MWRTQRGNNNAYAQDNEITWLDWEHADGALVDYVAALGDFRRAHPCLDGDRFLTGHAHHDARDVIWRNRLGTEMDNGQWTDPGASVLGMHLNMAGDEVLVWFNRMSEPASIPLGPTGRRWAVGLVSDDTAEVKLDRSHVVVPPRSVLALVPSQLGRKAHR
jgi:glycogen operon protein